MKPTYAVFFAIMFCALPGTTFMPSAAVADDSHPNPPQNLSRSAIPQPCLAVGYKTKTFATESNFSDSTVDMKQTYASGYQWYLWNWFSGWSPKNVVTLPGDGSLSAQGITGPNGQVASAAKIPAPPYFVGTAFGGGLCVDAEISFDSASVNSAVGFPAFWAMSKEHLDTQLTDQWPGQSKGYEHFAEWDILEYYKVKQPEFLSSWIDWYGIYKQTCPNAAYCKTASSFNNSPGAIPPATDWKQWHRVTGVWVPATTATPGHIQTFFDDRPLAEPYSWTQFSGQADALTSATPWRFGIVDKQHMVLIFGSNSAPIQLRNVRVFQASAAGNETN